MSGRRSWGAMPEGHDGIRIHFDDDEPPALVFHEQALPGALVSWAWCQLKALDSFLDAIILARQGGAGESDIAGAVQTILVPAINALSFSERRAHELQAGPAVLRPRAKKASRRSRRRRRPATA